MVGDVLVRAGMALPPAGWMNEEDACGTPNWTSPGSTEWSPAVLVRRLFPRAEDQRTTGVVKIVQGLRQSPNKVPTMASPYGREGPRIMVREDDIHQARRTLGRRLAAFRQAAAHGQEDFAPLVHYSRSSLANVEIGRQKGTRAFWEQCDQMLQTGGVLGADFAVIQLLERRYHLEAARQPEAQLAVPDAEAQLSIRARVARAAHESQAFLAQWESRCLGPQTVEEFAEDLSRLSAEY